MAAKRVVIVANKWWEADPLCGVLIHDRARPASLTNFRFLHYPAPRVQKPKPGEPRPPDPKAEPRLTFDCPGASVEVWCIEELMNPAENSSSSLEKSRVLGGAINYGATPDLVVAFGTASAPSEVSANGSVTIGRRVFIHDPRADAPDRTGLWTPPKPDQLIESALPAQALTRLDEQARYAAEARFMTSPVEPAAPPVTVISNGLVALGVVNITSYDDYIWADAEAMEEFHTNVATAQIGSIETTHGVIRSASESPFLYVSGIANSEGLFDYQVTPRVYAQNFVAAHNAALTLAWLLPSLAAAL
ncbi:MAG TPA: hypothetical protein VFX96_16080 [Pyrinomonadaceae bacterium]|nr:hypothetical protein [Pyrinomonadaceae bacterium]